ncbi:MAG: hypothetical protein CMN02_08180 [Roseibacillus sp.]|nr:hypothetical protein [Roseibacillus sp.]
MKPSRLLVILAFALPAAYAGEFKVEKKPFKSTVEFEGSFLSAEAHVIQIDPKVWTDFTIKELVAQGGVVKKGDPIVVLDTEGIERQLADDADATMARKTALKGSELELANLEQTTPWRLEAAELGYNRARDDHQYFVEVRRPLEEETAKRSLQSSERYLESATEELKQLLKMYKEDDLTEETEEIILKRQRYSVESAEFRLKSAKLSTKRALEVTIPRSAVDQEQALKDAEVAWKTARESLPAALQQKRLDVKKLQVADKRADANSVDLKADRAQMDVLAPADGIIYHGEMLNGRWNPTAAAKFMKVGGKIPPRVALASLIPAGAKLHLDAFVDEAAAAKLKGGQKGYVAPISSPRSRLSVELAKVATHPGVDGKYHIQLVLSAEGSPEGLNLVPGMKGKGKITTGDQGDRIAVPVKALQEEHDGTYTVSVKNAEGEASAVPVTVGVESNGMIVVLSGLQEGQIVITPDEPAAK